MVDNFDQSNSLTFRPNGWVTNILHHPLLLGLEKLLMIRQKADWVLNILPLWVKSRDGISRRIDAIESIFAAEEILGNPIYKQIESWLPEIQSFVDVGVNRGYFILYLNALTSNYRKRPLFGIGVDANPRILKIAESNLKANKINSVFIKHGVVGVKNSTKFFLENSDTLSGIFEVNVLGKKNKTKTINVDPISIEKTWKSLYGTAVCDLLKIDVEGAEGLFIDFEQHFIKSVKYIVVEYHGTPTTTREIIENKLLDLDFSIIGHESNQQDIGVIFAQHN